MATKKKKSSGSRSVGAGPIKNTEPRVQQFFQFGGCNFSLSPRDFDYTSDDENEQSDLQMNFFVVQNNVDLTQNKTLATRQNITKLYDAPAGTKLTGVATLIGRTLYAATTDDKIYYGDYAVRNTWDGQVEIEDVDGVARSNKWTYLGCADDKLVGMTEGLQLWTGSVASNTISNARAVPNPEAIPFSAIAAKGGLAISQTFSQDKPFKISIRQTHVNKFGPTLPSPATIFYANKPTTEWSGSNYLSIAGTAPTGYGIVAVELYYTEDEYQDASFLARVDMPSQNGGTWAYNWTGYLFDTSMWTLANLKIPTQNYTSGVPASQMIQHDGRLYFWGDKQNPGRLYVGGNPGNLFSISPGVGGGFADCEPGSGQAIRVVPKFKTASGASIVTMLCDSVNSSKENRFNLVDNNITLSNEQSAKGWQTEKVSGTVGTKSYHGAGVWADGLYAVSRYGLALTTMAMEYNSQLRVQYVSDAISPVFSDAYGVQLSASVLLCVNDVIYMTFGSPYCTHGDRGLDNVVFCYDITNKAWWSYTLDVDEPILNMINIDHESSREGIGIITPDHVFLLPTTRMSPLEEKPTFDVLIETGELSTVQPKQAMFNLTQMEFRFDYFIGDLEIELIGIDRFGRRVTTYKKISHENVMHDLVEYMRVDLVLESYKLVIRGKANFRMTHFLAKLFPKPARVGLVYGFDSMQSHNSAGDIHRYFKSYNDLREAIIP